MEQVEKKQLFYMILCRLGLLLVALAALRALSIHQDALSFALGLCGFWLIIAHAKITEKKWGISKKHSAMSTVIFVSLLLPLAYWFASPF